ncbi:PH domain-containing protein [Geobacillus stearothermophilus]|uniref:PH domain-containing protein n=1 Tax=Geobacillus stearothermophilus TaxID=1422 RepID=UPI00257B6DCE|nr:PH domain-containing protein [Geobacillus stearothermophilus]MED4358259.1 PH domain-containing protein [Geobacillus stearothermophilus]MED4879783.1 PH domain-containing protein [Geobacillus stearothermophilus]MED5010216.1 PH domain-containing protein [Geobacillus stearothermophilus]MED5015070.1 PH domain-containing protein [Geobacillus stearothermophilus]MED5043911.1 PH domain-containing protein [Geobacillus stearothermophilus]
MEVQYQQISPKAMKVRNLNELITSLISLVVITGLYFSTDYFNWWNWLRYVWIALFIITIIGIPWTYFVSSPIYYKTFRYGLTDDFLYIKSGVWTKVEVVVPMTKIQSIELIQGIIMRKYGVRSIEIKTMQGGVTIPHIKEEVAIKLRDDISKLARLKELDER